MSTNREQLPELVFQFCLVSLKRALVSPFASLSFHFHFHICNACHAELMKKAEGGVVLLLLMARVVLHRLQHKLVFTSAEGQLTETALQKTRSVRRECDDKEPTCHCRRCDRHRSVRGWGRSPGGQPTLVFLPGESHVQKSLAYCSL